jgi:hypothetical protein
MRYGKLNNGQLEVVNGGFVNEYGHLFWNPTEESLLANGYKPIIENRPNDVAGMYISESYSDNGNEIVVTYEYKSIDTTV